MNPGPSPLVPQTADPPRAPRRFEAHPSLEAVDLPRVDLCDGLLVLEGWEQRHAPFEALHGDDHIKMLLLGAPRAFLFPS